MGSCPVKRLGEQRGVGGWGGGAAVRGGVQAGMTISRSTADAPSTGGSVDTLEKGLASVQTRMCLKMPLD